MMNHSVSQKNPRLTVPQKRERLDKLTEREARESIREALTLPASVYLQQFNGEVR